MAESELIPPSDESDPDPPVTEPDSVPESPTPEIGITDDAIMAVEVTVRFSVGEIRTTLKDASSVQPGYIFETTTPVASPVTIELNGAHVGTGELVAIGDRIGVRVMEYPGHG